MTNPSRFPEGYLNVLKNASSDKAKVPTPGQKGRSTPKSQTPKSETPKTYAAMSTGSSSKSKVKAPNQGQTSHIDTPSGTKPVPPQEKTPIVVPTPKSRESSVTPKALTPVKSGSSAGTSKTLTPQQVAEKERHIAEVIEAVTERVAQQSPTKPLSQGQSRTKRERTPVSDVPKSDRELRSHSRQATVDEEPVVPSTPEVQMQEITPKKES